MNKHLRSETNSLFHYRKDMSGLKTLASRTDYPNYIYPKGDMEYLKNPNGALEELATEYGFTNPSYTSVNTKVPAHTRTFWKTCILIDCEHNKTFIEISNGENRLKNAEHETPKKILEILEYSYYFSGERNIENEI